MASHNIGYSPISTNELGSFAKRMGPTALGEVDWIYFTGPPEAGRVRGSCRIDDTLVVRNLSRLDYKARLARGEQHVVSEKAGPSNPPLSTVYRIPYRTSDKQVQVQTRSQEPTDVGGPLL